MVFSRARGARLLALTTLVSRQLANALPSASAAAAAALGMHTLEDEHHAKIGSSVFWWKLGFSIALVLLGGVFAGLTLGLMGLDELHLRVLASSSENIKERQNANKGTR
jgi:metal transporter CNNM